MTTFYGSKKQPKNVFGDATPELAEFYATLWRLFPGAMECLKDVQSCWNPEALVHKWTLDDGHIASVKVMLAEDKKVEIDELDHATYTYRTYVNKPEEQGLSLIANIVHSVDGYVVREMIRRCTALGFSILTIHDSFWAHPNNMDTVRKMYNSILAQIASTNLLERILNEITGFNGTLQKKSHDLAASILEANYALS